MFNYLREDAKNSLTVAAGEPVAILGASGSVKESISLESRLVLVLLRCG